MAYSKCPKMPVIPVEWEKNTTLTSIQKGADAFTFRTKAGGKAFSFVVTFPKVGGVRITENKGFFDCTDTYPVSYSGKKVLKISGGEQSVLFRKDDEKAFVLDVLNADGKVVMTLDGTSLEFGFAGNKIKRVKKFKLNVGFAKDEMLYGLGERTNTLDQAGHDVMTWNVDTAIHNPGGDNGKDHNEAYKNVPVLHSTAGYFLFVNSMYAGWYDFGKKTPYVYELEFNGPTTDFYVFTGTPKENLKSYTDLTGHTIIPPKWTLQYWMGGGAPQWKNPDDPDDKEYYKECFRRYIQGYADLGIHHIAACYGEGQPSLNKAGYEIAAEHGIRMLIWNHPSLNMDFCREVLGTDDWKLLPRITDKYDKPAKVETGGPWIDFTNPNTIIALRAHYKKYFEWGLKGAMIDFGEFVPGDALMWNGKDGNEMHNEHSYWYAKVMKQLFDENCGDDYILFQRSACAGSQGFVANFGGDQAARFYGLQQAYHAGVTIGASGFNVWGSDIGGYHGTPTPELFMRWMAYGAFSPIMRSHGIGMERNPWAYGEQATEFFKKLYWWRENMLNYMYSNVINSHYTAEPMMRAMAIEFPGSDVEKEAFQYMFGSELLVAPVIDEGRRCKMVAFPEGNWVNLWTRENYAGGRKMMVTADYDEIPVYLRAGAAMVLTLPESLEICENMEDKALVSALLTTAADGKREVKHYADENTAYTFVTDKVGDEAVTVVNQDGMKLDAVLVYGVEATKVLVDGKEVAFTAENNKTTVKTPAGFTKVEVF